MLTYLNIQIFLYCPYLSEKVPHPYISKHANISLLSLLICKGRLPSSEYPAYSELTPSITILRCASSKILKKIDLRISATEISMVATIRYPGPWTQSSLGSRHAWTESNRQPAIILSYSHRFIKEYKH